MCKKLSYLCSFILVLAVVPLAAYAQVDNLLLNPSFEEDELILDDPDWIQWITWGSGSGLNSTVEFDESEFVDGTRSLRIEPVGGTNWFFIVLYEPISLQVGTNYTASFWAKAETERILTAQLKATDNSVTWGSMDYQLGTEWTEYTFTSEAMNAEAKLEILCAGDETPLWLDFVYVYQGQYVAGIAPSGAFPPVKAAKPNPADKQTDVPRDVVLSWKPGEFADKHNVYFGTNFDDVNNADTDSLLLVGPTQDANSYNVDRLEFGRTYYWRIDEINAPPDVTVFNGDIWSFTIEPFAYPIPADSIIATASSNDLNQGPENTINKSGLDVNDLHSKEIEDMWLTAPDGPTPAWIQYEFDRIYKLHEMLVWNYNGSSILVLFGLKDVTIEYSTDNVNWLQLSDVPEFTQAIGTVGYAANNTVVFDGIAAKYVRINVNSNFGGELFPQYGLSEVRFLYIPVNAREPRPADGATEIAVDATLGWRAGREAAQHNLYFSTDQQAVIDGAVPAEGVSQASYGPLLLDMENNYYWRIEEVNNAETPSAWAGDIWSFSTQEYLVVDDFESYNDIPSGETDSNLVYGIWIDGYTNPATNGSTIGYVSGASMETDIVHGGDQSVPFAYDNTTAGSSEITVSTDDLAIGRDWTKGGAETLVLWFYGDPGNAATEQLYVKIGNKKVIYDGDAANIIRARWNQWNIDLAAQGVNQGNIGSLGIGFERTGASGGSGTVFIDDIRLYRSAPPVPVVTDPGTDALVAHYTFENNTQDSSGNNLHGTAVGSPNYLQSKSGFGMAIQFDGVDEYVDCGNNAAFDITEAITLAAWVRTNDAGNGEHNPFVGKGDQSYAIKHASNNSMEFFIFDDDWQTLQFSVDESFNGNWHHVAGTYDGTQLRLYVDGGLADSEEYIGSINSTTNSVNIGRNSQETDRFYQGAIDEVRIYNRALSEGEIIFLSNQ